ncbi:transcriptional regulator [Candidatus Woesearchaeota archaeon]|nr:transcriptional regulator [Candidatus Woesearchaeota archaeon]
MAISQKLIFPQEIEVWYVLPAIRKAFAIELIRCGLSQKNVAHILGVTEAAISQYKKEKRAHNLIFNEAIDGEIKKSAGSLRDKPETIFKEMMRINKLVKTTGLFCELHRSKCATPDDCETACYVMSDETGNTASEKRKSAIVKAGG